MRLMCCSTPGPGVIFFRFSLGLLMGTACRLPVLAPGLIYKEEIHELHSILPDLNIKIGKKKTFVSIQKSP